MKTLFKTAFILSVIALAGCSKNESGEEIVPFAKTNKPLYDAIWRAGQPYSSICNYDDNRDGKLSVAEIAAIRELEINGYWEYFGGKNQEYFFNVLKSFQGFEYLTSLFDFKCHNIHATDIDFSKCTALQNVKITDCRFAQLDFSKCILLNNIEIATSDITQLDLSNNTHLRYLRLSNMKNLKSLDISGSWGFLANIDAPNLEVLYVYENYPVEDYIKAGHIRIPDTVQIIKK